MTSDYSELRRQHNIMVLVGNGFDIQVTRRYQSRFSPRYPAFYHYLASRDFDPPQTSWSSKWQPPRRTVRRTGVTSKQRSGFSSG